MKYRILQRSSRCHPKIHISHLYQCSCFMAICYISVKKIHGYFLCNSLPSIGKATLAFKYVACPQSDRKSVKWSCPGQGQVEGSVERRNGLLHGVVFCPKKVIWFKPFLPHPAAPKRATQCCKLNGHSAPFFRRSHETVRSFSASSFLSDNLCRLARTSYGFKA